MRWVDMTKLCLLIAILGKKGDKIMAKMVDIEALKPILANILTEDNEASTIEAIMGITQDYDEDATQARIDDAVAQAKAEAEKDYASKLHDMFFGGTKVELKDEVIIDDSTTDIEDIKGVKEVEDIFS